MSALLTTFCQWSSEAWNESHSISPCAFYEILLHLAWPHVLASFSHAKFRSLLRSKSSDLPEAVCTWAHFIVSITIESSQLSLIVPQAIWQKESSGCFGSSVWVCFMLYKCRRIADIRNGKSVPDCCLHFPGQSVFAWSMSIVHDYRFYIPDSFSVGRGTA